MNLSIDLNIISAILGLMRIKIDRLSNKILEIINRSGEPLETTEIIALLKGETRVKVLYRLNNLRGDSLIRGKRVGSGKGVWIWWEIAKDEK